MSRTRETAKLRAQERALKAKVKALGFDDSLSMRWRYYHAAHPRASICCKRPPA